MKAFKSKLKTKIDDICPLCGKKGKVSIKIITDRIPYKKTHLLVEDTVLCVCGYCGEGYYTPEQFRAHSRQANIAVKKHEHLLLGEEIIRIRQKTGLPQQKLARRLGLSVKSFAKWESNQDVQSVQMDNLLRAIDRDPTLVDYLAAFRNAA
ncbi:MAG: type II toxin-antitoxin system MqsA family antitoxin [Deltaproteobacteria bacterium]|nr:type II toxin-antitoxin system MqsA family antitoxin [Deltaproteobacteria bacterium]